MATPGIGADNLSFLVKFGSPQNFSSDWVNLGGVIPTNGFNSIGLLIGIIANDSLDMRFRIINRPGGTGEPSDPEFTFPILTPSVTKVEVSPEFYEFANDNDQDYYISFNLSNVLNFVQFQIQAGFVGASPGQVSAAAYTLGQA